MKLVTGELWGGPLDGERAECLPSPSELGVFVHVDTKRITPSFAWPEPEDEYQLLGSYHWSDPKRLTWVPI